MLNYKTSFIFIFLAVLVIFGFALVGKTNAGIILEEYFDSTCYQGQTCVIPPSTGWTTDDNFWKLGRTQCGNIYRGTGYYAASAYQTDFYSLPSMLVTKGLSMSASNQYALTFWVRNVGSCAGGGNNSGLRVYRSTFQGTRGTNITPSPGYYGITSTSWSQKTINFTVPSNTTYYIQFDELSGSNDYIVIDDVIINESVPGDTIPPSVGQTSPTSATVNVAATFSASVSDNVGVTSCNLYVDGVSQGTMSGSFPCTSCTASRSHTFTSTGNHTMYARCYDAAGNNTSGTSVTVTVSSVASPPVAHGIVLIPDNSSEKVELYAEGTQWLPDSGDFSERSTNSFEGSYSTHNRGSWVRKTTSFSAVTYPSIVFAYKIDVGETACLMINGGGWVEIADTPTTCSSYSHSANAITLINDGHWHIASVDISDRAGGTHTSIISGGTGDIYLDNVYAIKNRVAPGEAQWMYINCYDDDTVTLQRMMGLINYQGDQSAYRRGYMYWVSPSSFGQYPNYGDEYSDVLSGSSSWKKGNNTIAKIKWHALPIYTSPQDNDISQYCDDGPLVSGWNNNDLNFDTYEIITVPTVTTDIATVGATEIQNNRAIFRGTISGDGGTTVTQTRFCWSNSPNISACNNIVSGSVATNFQGTLTNMTSGQIYYYKTQAYNSAGWSNLADTNERRAVIFLSDGGQQQFTTQTACTRADPSVSLTPSSQTGDPGQQLTYTITVTNNDNSACGASTFNLSNSCPSGWTCSRSASSLSISPGSQSTAYLYVTSASGVSAGNYTVSATATNSGATSYTGTGNATYAVAIPCTRADPSVSLTPSSQTGDPGQQLTYTITVTNNDNSACGASTFNLSNSCPSGWTCSRSASSLSISPGSQSTAYLYVTSASGVSAGNYTVSATATNSGATSYTGTGNATYAVAINNPPTCSSIGANPVSGNVPLNVIFTGAGSDSDGSIAYCQWDFDYNINPGWDDITSASNDTCDSIGYSYSSAGIYCVKLRVQDNLGAWSSPHDCDCIQPCCSTQITVSPTNQPPQVLNPVITNENYCTPFKGDMTMSFSWTYYDPDGNPGSSFQFRINDVNNVDAPNPKVDSDYTMVIPNNTTQTQTVPVSINPGANELSYNSIYYWWVKVFDDSGDDSGWIPGQGSPFSTPIHPYPYPDFTPFPSNPNLNAQVTFLDESKCYTNELVEYNCQTNSNIRYQWDFGIGSMPATCDSGTVPDSPCRGNATTSYSTMGGKTISLTITDELGKTCSATEEISVSVPLPEWKETAPF